MHRLRRLLLIALGSIPGLAAWAGHPVNWSFSAAAAGSDTVRVQLRSECAPGWHIYALSLPSDEGPLPTMVHVADGPGYLLAGSVVEPAPEEKVDQAFGVLVRFHSDTATFVQHVVRRSGKPFTVHGSVEYMACNDMTCLPPTTVEFNLDIPPVQ